MKKISLYLIFIISLFICTSSYSQVNDNLNSIYSLIDSSASEIINNNKYDSLKNYINVIAPDNYMLLKNRALFSFKKNDIHSKSMANKFVIIYSIDKVGVNYTDIFRDGLFGAYLLERKVFLKGSIRSTSNNNSVTKEFYFSKTDTVNYGDLKQLENPYLPFTKGKVPAEPFFSSLLEPIIVVGTIVATVLLLFNARSK